MPSVQTRVIMTVICFLGATSLLLSAGVLFLAHEGKAPDAGLYTLAGTVIGALGALLTSTRSTHGGTPEEPIAVTADEPLPVTDESPPESEPSGPAASPLSKAVHTK